MGIEKVAEPLKKSFSQISKKPVVLLVVGVAAVGLIVMVKKMQAGSADSAAAADQGSVPVGADSQSVQDNTLNSVSQMIAQNNQQLTDAVNSSLSGILNTTDQMINNASTQTHSDMVNAVNAMTSQLNQNLLSGSQANPGVQSAVTDKLLSVIEKLTDQHQILNTSVAAVDVHPAATPAAPAAPAANKAVTLASPQNTGYAGLNSVEKAKVDQYMKDNKQWGVDQGSAMLSVTGHY